MAEICFLSGLEIRKGKKSTEHYYPKSLLPYNMRFDRRNLFPADKVINTIKSNLTPCKWEQKKFDRVYFAISHYDLRVSDKEFLQKTLDNWETYRINPCQWCIMQVKCKERGEI